MYFAKALKAFQPSIKYAVFATTATLLIPHIIPNIEPLNPIFSLISLKSRCDSNKTIDSDSTANSQQEKEYQTRSIIQEADEAIEKSKTTIKTPQQFENIKNIIQQASVNTYDGFRFTVQKQINLNTVVSHFFWMGSAQVPPMYQYRIILPLEDNKYVVNVASDPDFNIEAELKANVNPNVSAKANIVLGEQAKAIEVNIDMVDDCSATQIEIINGPNGQKVGLSYMQALSPAVSIGGQAKYVFDKNILEQSYAGMYDEGEHQIAGCYEQGKELRVKYMRRVNPGRMHVSSEIAVDKNAASTMSVGAEYTYKQGRLHFAVDSNLAIKSMLETTVSPGMNLTLCAEASELNSAFKFGSGLTIG